MTKVGRMYVKAFAIFIPVLIVVIFVFWKNEKDANVISNKYAAIASNQLNALGLDGFVYEQTSGCIPGFGGRIQRHYDLSSCYATLVFIPELDSERLKPIIKSHGWSEIVYTVRTNQTPFAVYESTNPEKTCLTIEGRYINYTQEVVALTITTGTKTDCVSHAQYREKIYSKSFNH